MKGKSLFVKVMSLGEEELLCLIKELVIFLIIKNIERKTYDVNGHYGDCRRTNTGSEKKYLELYDYSKEDTYQNQSQETRELFTFKTKPDARVSQDSVNVQKMKRYEKFHKKLGNLIAELSPPGFYYEKNDRADMHNSWRFIKDLCQDYVQIKKKYQVLESRIFDM